MTNKDTATKPYWSSTAEDLLHTLSSTIHGLSDEEAARRLTRDGSNQLRAHGSPGTRASLTWSSLRDPLVLILIGAALIALLVGDALDALTLLGIIAVSTVLGVLQQYRAQKSIDELRKHLAITSMVLRNGRLMRIPSAEIVVGDVVDVQAGSMFPADGIVLTSRDLFVSQALLTGESLPVERFPGVVDASTPVAERTNSVHQGTSVRSGVARILITATGRATQMARLAEHLDRPAPRTAYETGVRQFSVFLLRVTLTAAVVVLATQLIRGYSVMDTLLFSLALAVAISPQLLPAIVSITLSHGSRRLARAGVIVKRLTAIENLGSMSVLCTDKTGTLTDGVMRVVAAVDAHGRDDASVFAAAHTNARLQTGIASPLDDAIVEAATQGKFNITAADSIEHALDEIPFDFERKRLTILAQASNGEVRMTTKGAAGAVLSACTSYAVEGASSLISDRDRERMDRQLEDWGATGYRVLAVASKDVGKREHVTRADEVNMTLLGFLLFSDPPLAGVHETIDALSQMGVQLKVITGDNRYVTRHVAESAGIDSTRCITGSQFEAMTPGEKLAAARDMLLFAEVAPSQKEAIVLALRAQGAVVGYVGDGINDAPALHAADVGISVGGAVDVAKDAADIVLTTHDLNVIRLGIHEGRHTMANTLKYIFITTSANFGNMVSMVLASTFMPFLPLLAKQILLTNFLSDLPSMGLAVDDVDRNWEATPHRWDTKLIRSFMFVFGLLSTVFDMAAFWLLSSITHGNAALFRTGWFTESLISELLILFVVRTFGPVQRSRPSRILLWLSAAIIIVTLALPYSPFAAMFELTPLPAPVLASLLAITLAYILAAEVVKHIFVRRMRIM